jgi:transcriptional regulator with AAA-type ATPase domain
LGFDSLAAEQRETLERWLGSAPAGRPENHATALVLGVSARPSRQIDDWLNGMVSRGTLQQIRLPTLADRAEDLQALILETLTRLGVGPDGEPLGLEPAVLRMLLDHDWAGNDAELKGVLTRAASRCRGTRIGMEDLAELTPLSKPPFDVAAHGSALHGSGLHSSAVQGTDLHFGSASRRRHSPRRH